MDPRLQQAIPGIIAALQRTQPQVAQEIQQWATSGGTSPLSGAAAAALVAMAPQVGVPAALVTAAIGHGVSSRLGTTPGMNVPGASSNVVGQVNSPVEGQAPDSYGQGRVGPVPGQGGGPPTLGTPNVPPRPGENVPAAATGGVRPNSPVEGNVPELGAVAGPSGTPLTPQAAQQAYVTSAADRGRATPGSTPGSAGNPGGFGNVTAGALAEDDDYLLRFAMQSAGFNPDIITPGSRIAAQKLAPMVSARRNVYGLLDPNGGNEGGLPQDIAQFAHDFTDKGTNFYQNATDYGKQILSGAGFANIGGVADQEKRMAMYQALIPLLFGGANPLVQQSAGDQTKKLFNLYKDADIRGGDQGKSTIFEDFVKQYAGMNPLLKSIFGNIR